MTIAGHTWTDTPRGRGCATCSMLRRVLHQATPEDVGRLGWAHVGALNSSEYSEIIADRDEARGVELERLWQAVQEIGRATT
jgi:hypothetical protein